MSLDDTRFHAVLREMGDLHDKKRDDYGVNGDPYQNFRAAEEYGVLAWIGAVIRAGDKDQRIKAFARKGRLSNETVRDSLIDRANYSVIALVLYDEAQQRRSRRGGRRAR